MVANNPIFFHNHCLRENRFFLNSFDKENLEFQRQTKKLRFRNSSITLKQCVTEVRFLVFIDSLDIFINGLILERSFNFLEMGNDWVHTLRTALILM